MAILAIILFISIFLLILYGYPVALTLGGLSVIYALCFLDPAAFSALPPRIMGVMSNYVLLAVPLFIYMGIMLERSGLAESLLETMAILFGKIKGGLAISVLIVGTMLAASTGIVGATVITMGLISLPVMLKRGYQPELATGTIASSGTLGQIIPPSIVLVLLGSVLNVSVGKLFAAALVPGMILVVAYIIYTLIFAHLRPELAPSIPPEEIEQFKSKDFGKKVVKAFVLPILLIVAVLGSIFAGIASPTEAAAVGALGASILTMIQGKFNLETLQSVMRETTHLTSMVFLILLGATTFSFVFREMQGDIFLVDLIRNSNLSPMIFLLLVMAIVFVAGFFIDFIEIIFIIVPVVSPIFVELNIDLIWIGILLALNLQTSFLTPPFGFSLFYLKGVAPPGVTTGHLYRGIIPFLVIQLLVLLLVVFFPDIALILVQ
ncbi:TRAP transporter large permease [Flavilitoribacter nigricans]|uniref:C4-dicarboxylate ABC transporter n=1 Tax=Flavilitoribacter nigricans (strain ATCC 23147 / DSM 23189 / NBRC 102662 / NCIMB 1420 / SS-2) TaxID=1122177 RepID=A0A2D0N2I9_FLAN2|nr:TRAP transporter large permease subunit [Flavilitoribacter nigricans]PHN02606.1 C4-dicarboxylate ABC transporter [Flavilitoribacter nigricans DSM 23189 = NBRC 102662]